jgi:hypothetical protein
MTGLKQSNRRGEAEVKLVVEKDKGHGLGTSQLPNARVGGWTDDYCDADGASENAVVANATLFLLTLGMYLGDKTSVPRDIAALKFVFLCLIRRRIAQLHVMSGAIRLGKILFGANVKFTRADVRRARSVPFVCARPWRLLRQH